ncbi:MAG: (deoxy)nucleoside triphosphate pyrophosphohydrolase [Deltaproteobacteria bacterium]|nr:(deoxy)nucleoside triphosphate pyrophosphohydrolase [Deltaproteobacteria bacterium]
MSQARPTVLVVAAVIVEHGRVLVTQRMPGSHLAGAWEFPGGKVEQDEDPRDALVRELREELGVEVEVGAILDVAFHRYPGKSVLILFYEAHRRPGSPAPAVIDVAALQWRTGAELVDQDFPPADASILATVRRLLEGEAVPASP